MFQTRSQTATREMVAAGVTALTAQLPAELLAAHAIDPAEGSAGPHSPQLQPSESYDYTFAKAGSFRYIDVMQPTHGGIVTVNN